MFFSPVHDTVVDEALEVEEILEESSDPVVVGFFLVL